MIIKLPLGRWINLRWNYYAGKSSFFVLKDGYMINFYKITAIIKVL